MSEIGERWGPASSSQYLSSSASRLHFTAFLVHFAGREVITGGEGGSCVEGYDGHAGSNADGQHRLDSKIGGGGSSLATSV